LYIPFFVVAGGLRSVAISTSDKEGGFKGCKCHHACHTWTLFMSFCFVRCRDQILLLLLFLIEIAKIRTLFVSSRSLKQSFPFSILIKSLSLSLIGGSQTGFEGKILLHGHSMKMKLLREEDGKYDQPDEI
jgi:hypothetical protein